MYGPLSVFAKLALFKETRDFILLYYDIELINDEDFLLLYHLPEFRFAIKIILENNFMIHYFILELSCSNSGISFK